MDDLIHCIYASAIAADFDEAKLPALLTAAREKNQRLGLTGMLLFARGSFFQVLEGPAGVVDALYETIAADPRHRKVTKIIREPIAKRYFGDWTMGFSTMTQAELADLVGINDFFSQGQALVAIDTGRAKKLLTAFRQGRWHMRLAGSQHPA